MWDTLINFWNMGIQSFLIFSDNCRIILKDMEYFLTKLMGYGILGPPPPFQGLTHVAEGARLIFYVFPCLILQLVLTQKQTYCLQCMYATTD